MEAYGKVGMYSGPLFWVSQKGNKVQWSLVGDLDVLFHGILQWVQEQWPLMLPQLVQIQDEFIMCQSRCRGSMTEASNKGIPQEVIEANQRWGKHQWSQGVLLPEHEHDGTILRCKGKCGLLDKVLQWSVNHGGTEWRCWRKGKDRAKKGEQAKEERG